MTQAECAKRSRVGKSIVCCLVNRTRPNTCDEVLRRVGATVGWSVAQMRQLTQRPLMPEPKLSPESRHWIRSACAITSKHQDEVINEAVLAYCAKLISRPNMEAP